MIKVEAQQGRDSVFSLTADGHANAARNEDGRDLVCCAVSTIMCMLANSCALIDDVNTTYHTGNGYAQVVVHNISEEIWPEIASRFQMALDGLEGLSVQYPQCVQVTVEN